MKHGFKIKQLRDSKHIKQEELAKAIGITQSQLSKIESGQVKKVGQNILDKIATYTKTNVDYFQAEGLYINHPENKDSSIGVTMNTEIMDLLKQQVADYKILLLQKDSVIDELKIALAGRDFNSRTQPQ